MEDVGDGERLDGSVDGWDRACEVREALRGRVPSVRRGDGHGAWERSQPPPQSTTADNVRNVKNSKLAVSNGRHRLLCGGPQMRGSRAQPG